MRLLLDTHIWLWSVMEAKRLSGRVSRALLSPANELWISPVSTWEILQLIEKGRLNLGTDVLGWIETSMLNASLREAPLTHEVVMSMRTVNLPHRDPADRFLAATAKCLDLTLVSADENLISGSGYSVLANK